MYTHKLNKKYFHENGEIKVKLYGRCVVTKEIYSVTVLLSELIEYENGKMAQNAFPRLLPGERDFLISGVSPLGNLELYPPGGEG